MGIISEGLFFGRVVTLCKLLFQQKQATSTITNQLSEAFNSLNSNSYFQRLSSNPK